MGWPIDESRNTEMCHCPFCGKFATVTFGAYRPTNLKICDKLFSKYVCAGKMFGAAMLTNSNDNKTESAMLGNGNVKTAYKLFFEEAVHVFCRIYISYVKKQLILSGPYF